MTATLNPFDPGGDKEVAGAESAEQVAQLTQKFQYAKQRLEDQFEERNELTEGQVYGIMHQALQEQGIVDQDTSYAEDDDHLAIKVGLKLLNKTITDRYYGVDGLNKYYTLAGDKLSAEAAEDAAWLENLERHRKSVGAGTRGTGHRNGNLQTSRQLPTERN